MEPTSNRSTRKRGQQSATTNYANHNIIDVLNNNDNGIKCLPLKLAYINSTKKRRQVKPLEKFAESTDYGKNDERLERNNHEVANGGSSNRTGPANHTGVPHGHVSALHPQDQALPRETTLPLSATQQNQRRTIV